MSASADRRRRYPLVVELSLLLALGLVTAAFVAPVDFADDVTVIVNDDEPFTVVETPVTVHRRALPPPPAPVEVPDTHVIEHEIDLPALSEEIGAPVAALTLPDMPDLEPPPLDTEVIYRKVEEDPVLIGGLEGLQRRVSYPELARRAGIEGTVFVQFIVDEEGRIVDAACVRDPGGGTCDEALRAVNASRFTPGKQRGKPVKVRFSMPIKFRLN